MRLAWHCTLALHIRRHMFVLQALSAQVLRAKAQGSATARPAPEEAGAASPPSDRAVAQGNGVAGTPLKGVQAAATQQMPKALPNEADGELQCIVCSVTCLSVEHTARTSLPVGHAISFSAPRAVIDLGVPWTVGSVQYVLLDGQGAFKDAKMHDLQAYTSMCIANFVQVTASEQVTE